MKSAKDTTAENLTKASKYVSSTWSSYFGGWGSKAPKDEEQSKEAQEEGEGQELSEQPAPNSNLEEEKKESDEQPPQSESALLDESDDAQSVDQP